MKNEQLNLPEEEITVDQNDCNTDKLAEVLLRAENAKGSYLTPFDRLLLEFLYTEQVVINTEELWMTLKREGVKISIATVQLCLNRFHRCGLLEKQRLEGEKKHCYSFIN
ncbi:hypothetical protein DBR43_26310 [Pedobacter sp. KBW06]|uniref:transcriptional repressor n=1 Tax=Pedobacter sp. KBW06 TaxID=2153359 RepID=UPI000F59B549|nr:transcriptional repressor [Pedobacter sp. KBW06]RQO68021.1 hypothetical protein DBR43_26310 [Pedobacter sp. KBW06]